MNDVKDITMYKFRYTFQSIILFIITYGFLTFLFILDKSIIYFNFKTIMIIFGWFVFFLCIPSLLSIKVFINSEEISIQSMRFYKKTRKILKWEEISKVEYRSNTVILLNNTNTKLTFLKSAWKNYNQLYFQIYQNILKNNPTCKIDYSLIEYLRLTYNGKNITKDNVELTED